MLAVNFKSPEPIIAFHLLGTVEFDVCASLQRRLAYEAGERNDGQIDVLLCEHPEIITVGSSGSWGHIRLDKTELTRRQLEVRWVSRGGGCVLHSPGQLAVYPIVPLARFGWTAEHYLSLLSQACVATFAGLSIHCESHPGASGLWGRSGQLAELGISIRHGIATDGLFIHVNPTSSAVGYIDCAPPDCLPRGVKPTAGSLLAERRQPVRISAVRSAVVSNLAAAFGCERYHLHTGHPYLPASVTPNREFLARVS